MDNNVDNNPHYGEKIYLEPSTTTITGENGETITKTEYPDGQIETFVTSSDATTKKIEYPDGQVYQEQISNDGQTIIVNNYPDGQVYQNVTTTEGYSAVRTIYPDGQVYQETKTSEGVRQVIKEDGFGNQTVTDYFLDGSTKETSTVNSGVTKTTTTQEDGTIVVRTMSENSTMVREEKIGTNGITTTTTTCEDGTIVEKTDYSSVFTTQKTTKPNGTKVDRAEYSSGLTIQETTTDKGLYVKRSESSEGLVTQETKGDINVKRSVFSGGRVDQETTHPDGTTFRYIEDPDGTKVREVSLPLPNQYRREETTWPDGTKTIIDEYPPEHTVERRDYLNGKIETISKTGDSQTIKTEYPDGKIETVSIIGSTRTIKTEYPDGSVITEYVNADGEKKVINNDGTFPKENDIEANYRVNDTESRKANWDYVKENGYNDNKPRATYETGDTLNSKYSSINDESSTEVANLRNRDYYDKPEYQLSRLKEFNTIEGVSKTVTEMESVNSAMEDNIAQMETSSQIVSSIKVELVERIKTEQID